MLNVAPSCVGDALSLQRLGQIDVVIAPIENNTIPLFKNQ